jgi:hypothetical protein
MSRAWLQVIFGRMWPTRRRLHHNEWTKTKLTEYVIVYPYDIQ